MLNKIGTCLVFVIVVVQSGCQAPEDAIEAAATGNLRQAISQCGPTPTASPCITWTCNTTTGEWEDTLKPAGTVCQTTGKCDPSGVCRLPISPPPALSAGTSPVIYDHNAISFLLTCGGRATSHKLMRSLNGAAAVQIGVWTQDGATYLGLDPCPSATRWLLDQNDLRGGDRVCYTAVASTYGDSKSSATLCYDIPLNTTPPVAPGVSVIRMVKGARIDITDRSPNEIAFLLYTRTAGVTDATSLVNPVGVPGPWTLRKTWTRPGRGGGDRSTGGLLSELVGGLDPAVTYDVKVEVRSDFSAQQAEAMASFRPLPPVPGAPSLGRLYKTDMSDTLRISPEPYAVNYRLHFSDRAGNVGAAATPEQPLLTPTVTGLQPATEYCFVATASNETGTSLKSNVICDTTLAAVHQRVAPVALQGISYQGSPTVTGRLEINDGLIDLIEVRAADNVASLAGLALQAQTEWSQPCDLSAPGTIFVPPDGVIDGPDMVQLYGTEHPHLGLGGLTFRGCSAHGVAMASLPTVTVQVHYTGP